MLSVARPGDLGGGSSYLITKGPSRYQTSIASGHWGPNAYDYVALFSVLALCKYIHFYKPTITIGLAGLAYAIYSRPPRDEHHAPSKGAPGDRSEEQATAARSKQLKLTGIHSQSPLTRLRKHRRSVHAVSLYSDDCRLHGRCARVRPRA